MNTSEPLSSTKTKILEAALHLFSKKGYLGAATREIAREAGLAEVTLFRHFPSKEKLLEEVINSYSFLPTLKGLLPEVVKMPYEKALDVIATRFLDTLDARKDMIRIMHSEVPRYPEKINKIYHAIADEIVKNLASYFHEMQRTKVLREFDSVLGARAFLGMLFSYFNAREFHMHHYYRNLDVKKIVSEYVKFFARGTLKKSSQ